MEARVKLSSCILQANHTPRQHLRESFRKYDRQMALFLLYPLCIGDVSAETDAQR